MVMEMEKFISKDEVRSPIKSGRAYRDVSILLKTKYPGITGRAERSVRRFCKHEELDEEVARAVAEVGPSYGRKTMTGLLRARGVHEERYRIQQSLKHVNPTYHHQRQNDTESHSIFFTL